jgi:uncharacterized protein (DUF4415 family)
MSRKLIRPSAEEDALINQGIEQDPDTMVLSDEQFAEAVKRKRGRPTGSFAEMRKEQVTMRLDPDVLAALRATGSGWQSRVNQILREATRPAAKKAGSGKHRT